MFEKEIKILDVDVQEAEQKLRDFGAEFIFKTKQKIYTYDLPTISHRLSEAIDMLKTNVNLLTVYAYKQKLKTILLEAEDLLPDADIIPVIEQYSVQHLPDIIDVIDNIDEFTTLPIINKIQSLHINPNKWVRLRDTNGNVTLTVKHVFDKNTDSIQKVAEYEIKVDSVDEADRLLVALGFAKRNVQEKIRTQYRYKNAEIDIDQWPRLRPYIEIESDDTGLYQEIIDGCGLGDKKIVSCNTEDLYREIGINSRETPELLFE
nr:CYTH domain-containing protein [Candidatus Enterousia merdequi]